MKGSGRQLGTEQWRLGTGGEQGTSRYQNRTGAKTSRQPTALNTTSTQERSETSRFCWSPKNMEMLGDISWHEPGKEVRSKTDNISINLHALKQHSKALSFFFNKKKHLCPRRQHPHRPVFVSSFNFLNPLLEARNLPGNDAAAFSLPTGVHTSDKAHFFITDSWLLQQPPDINDYVDVHLWWQCSLVIYKRPVHHVCLHRKGQAIKTDYYSLFPNTLGCVVGETATRSHRSEPEGGGVFRHPSAWRDILSAFNQRGYQSFMIHETAS